MSKSYKAKTKNNEKELIDDIEVNETDTTTEIRPLTLKWIDYTLGSIQEKMDILQESFDEYTALRAAVLKEAKKIKLKLPEVEPVVE